METKQTSLRGRQSVICLPQQIQRVLKETFDKRSGKKSIELRLVDYIWLTYNGYL